VRLALRAHRLFSKRDGVPKNGNHRKIEQNGHRVREGVGHREIGAAIAIQVRCSDPRGTKPGQVLHVGLKADGRLLGSSQNACVPQGRGGRREGEVLARQPPAVTLPGSPLLPSPVASAPTALPRQSSMSGDCTSIRYHVQVCEAVQMANAGAKKICGAGFIG
jgi:hypothetical protein